MDIIGRDEWGARYPDGFRDAPLPAREVWLHHSAGGAPDLAEPYDDDYQTMRHLEDVGEQRFGGGISYTFVITPVGLIFEGHSVWRQGSHTGGRNDISRAICWPGNYEYRQPTREQIDATAWLLAHGHAQGWWTEPALTGGHRQAPGAATACPGDNAMAVIDDINRRAAAPEEDIMATLDELRQLLREEQALQAKTSWNWTMAGEAPYLPEDRAWVMQRETRDGIRRLLEAQGIDPAEVARQVAELAAPMLVEEVADAVSALSDEDLQRIATAVADEHARRVVD